MLTPPGLGLLRDVIDFGQAPCSADDAGPLVHRGVCPQLDELRDTYDALPDLLTQARALAACAQGLHVLSA